VLTKNWGNYLILGIVTLLVTVICGLLANNNLIVYLIVSTAFILFFWIATFILRPQLQRMHKKQAMMEQIRVSAPGDPEKLEELYASSLFYCTDLIDYYNGARYRMRIYYILSQLSIALLTGVTPILILLKESDLVAGQWFTWVTIVVPGLASIVASVSTIFHFQEEWVQSKTTAESLEAILQEYQVGVPDRFNVSATKEPEKTFERKKALENLIIAVNQIHLKQMEVWASLQRSMTQVTPPAPTVEDIQPPTAPRVENGSQPTTVPPRDSNPDISEMDVPPEMDVPSDASKPHISLGVEPLATTLQTPTPTPRSRAGQVPESPGIPSKVQSNQVGMDQADNHEDLEVPSFRDLELT
jgi:hypothetical protein